MSQEGMHVASGAPDHKSSFMVHWRARILISKGDIRDTVVSAIKQGGFFIKFDHALPLGKEIGLEFHVNFENKKHQIRIKAKVAYCRLLSNNSGSEIELKTSMINREDNHTLNNIIHTFLNAKEINLKR